jgi:phage shock protein PspC (stress-responsive transcriptional regulator)
LQNQLQKLPQKTRKMKKTITINIAGLVFNIEEGAYSSLKNYLESIGNKFNNLGERQEIIEDIEARIAELFSEKLNRNKEVINEVDVDNIISVMGSPDNFEEEESTEYSETKSESKSTKTNEKKKFFRDPDSRVVGGVCAGVSNYFDWDVSIVRVVFALSVLLLGTGFWLYIILWLIIPEAKSTSEKLAMEGKNATVNNIKGFFTKFKNDIESIDTSNVNKNIKKQSNKFNQFLVGTSQKFNDTFRPKENVTNVFKFIFSFIGFILISIGIILFFSVTYSLFMPNETGLNEMFNEFAIRTEFNVTNVNLIKIAFAVFTLSIAISLILTGIRLAFSRQTKIVQSTKPLRVLSRFTIIFSIIGLIALLLFNKASFSKFSHYNSHTIDYKTIIVKKLAAIPANENPKRIKLDIRKTEHNTAWIRVAVKGTGFRSLSSSLTPYEYNITDSIIELSPYLYTKKGIYIEKDVDITLYIPDNDSTVLINEFDD